MTPFLQALSFLTVLRVPASVVAKPPGPWTAVWFPVLGALLGGGLAALLAGLRLAFPPLVGAGLTVALWILATGAIHLDGLIDCADALPGLRTPEERMRILKDPTVGAYGVAAGACGVLLKVAATAAAPVWAPVLAGTLGRWACLVAMVAQPYHGRDGHGSGSTLTLGLGGRHLLAGSLVPAGIALAAGWVGVAMLAAAALAALGFARLAAHRLPAATGDVYGAIIETAEIATLCLSSTLPLP
ncbi:MAG: adenosylcobinamide-GDP ribazoletransferase [candidate division NC10 bacterium]|nr:adenosylcobinamide-GDP ribazoletransferase [candidate division NC10 bacterium]